MTTLAETGARFDDLRAMLTQARGALEAALPTHERPQPIESFGIALGRRYARAVDDLLLGMFERLGGAARWEGIELAGIGSYGRGALALKSDLDVRVLAKSAERASAFADALLYPLWDMGVAIGHQVVAPDELADGARRDLPSATSLLDWRHVAGDRSLEATLRARAAEGVFDPSELPEFLARLEAEVKSRHERFGGSVYLLEPDVKNGPGGLRDLDVARWAAKSRFGVGEPEELVRVGALVPREATEMMSASDLLWRIRNLLHAHANRRSDRLTFDEQESISSLLGYGEGGEAVERFMSDYYRAARTISRAQGTLLARATPVLTRRKPRDEDLGGGVHLFDGSVTLGDAEHLKREPSVALRLVAFAVQRGVAILPRARDLVMRATSDPAFTAELRASPEACSIFVELVATCQETSLRGGSVLRELHDLGLLLAMIPEFLPVVGRVHHDTYHVYTVDVHSVAAVDRLASLVRGDLAEEYPLACRLAAEIARPRMLFFATLLHDVGKAIGGTDHSQRGADMAVPILTRLGLSPEDVDDAAHLIRKHLVMYHVATRRDLDDPATIAELTRDVRGRDGLRDLYLLTVADLSTTSPTSMTSWKARMLDELYLATDGALGGQGTTDERALRAKDEVSRAFAESGGSDVAFLESYLASMPERYLLSNAPAAIAAHAELARGHRSAVTIGLVPSRHPEAAEVCIIADDRPGLLAAITAAIAGSRLEVHAAQIHTRRAAEGTLAVDLFWVRDRTEGVDGAARAIPKLQRDLLAVLEGRAEKLEIARLRAPGRLDRGGPKVRTQIAIDDRASPRHTVIEVVSRDRPGLLFALSEALYRLGLTIAVAKINTEGTRAADVFYVSEADGSKVASGGRCHEIEVGLSEALARLEQEGNAVQKAERGSNP